MNALLHAVVVDDLFLRVLREAVGAAHVLTSDADKRGYLTDWRNKFTGRALAVVRPGNTPEVAAVMRLCHQHQISVVPQGGNTGLSGGATPDGSGRSVVLSLARMNQVRSVDVPNLTLVAEAGCILQTVQDLATSHGTLFPLSLAAEGSCTIGGNLATNAGGTQVLRYGNARDLCLGLEVVTAQGEIWNGLHGLRKDNTGYDLRHLMIGSEGTLGIITAAVLKLHPMSKAQVTAMVAVASPAQAVALLGLAQQHLGPTLTAFEWISQPCLQAVVNSHAAPVLPFQTLPCHAVLLEVSDHEDEAHATHLLEDFLALALEHELASDAVVAKSLAQSQQLWVVREGITEALQGMGSQAKHDVSVPISSIAAFVEQAGAALQQAHGDVQVMAFGHLGDGNLHYNLVWQSLGPVADAERHDTLNRLVHDLVAAHRGSISAEHGLGQLRRDESARLKSPVELALMRSVKAALDPHNLLNPGKVLAAGRSDVL